MIILTTRFWLDDDGNYRFDFSLDGEQSDPFEERMGLNHVGLLRVLTEDQSGDYLTEKLMEAANIKVEEIIQSDGYYGNNNPMAGQGPESEHPGPLV